MKTSKKISWETRDFTFVRNVLYALVLPGGKKLSRTEGLRTSIGIILNT
jgi:hypothetical protein